MSTEERNGMTIMTDRDRLATERDSASRSRGGRAAVAPDTDLGRLDLLTRLGATSADEVWLARLGDGREVAARHVRCASPAALARLLRTVAALRSVHDGTVLRVLGTAVCGQPDAVWVVSQAGGGVPLRRVMSVSELHPLHVLGVLRAVTAGLRELDEAGFSHGALDADCVEATAEGTVRLALRPAAVLRSTRASRRRDLDAVTGLLESMLARGRRAGVGGGTSLSVAARLRALLESRGLSQAATPAEACALLEECIVAIDGAPGDGVAAQLAALVAAVRPPALRDSAPAATVAVTGTAVPAARAAAPAAAEPAAEPRVETAAGAHRPGITLPWLRAATPAIAVCAAALLVVVVAVVAVLHGRGHSTPAAASPVHRAAPARPAPQRPPLTSGVVAAPQPLAPPQLAPAATATIRAVSMPALVGACTGPVCTVTVRVTLPPHGSEGVAWSLDVVDRCSGTVTRQPGGAVQALPRFQYVFDSSRISIPAGRPVAVIAVTAAPSVAASPPLLLGPQGC